MNPIVHFEMPYSDQDLCKFYAAAFGWQMNKTGPDMGNYVVAVTTETDENRMVKTPGTINGGFFPKQPALSIRRWWWRLTTLTMPSIK